MALESNGSRQVSHLFMALACAAVFCGAAALNAAPAFRSVQSYLWPKALGVVTSASPGESGGGLLGVDEAPRIEYRFRAGGRNFRGNRICYGGALLPMTVFDASFARKASALSVGDKVPLYHHPEDPSVNVIHRGICLSMVIELAVALLLLMCGVNRWNRYLYDDSPDEPHAPGIATSSRAVDSRVLPVFQAYAEKIRDLNSAFYIYPDLPRRRLANAIESYAPGFSPDKETPLVLVDDSLSGSAGKGCLMTDRSLYGSEIDPERRVPLEELGDIRITRDGIACVICLRSQRLQTLSIPSAQSVTQFVQMMKRIALVLSGIPYEEGEEDALYIVEGDPDPEIVEILNAKRASLKKDGTWFLEEIPRPLLENAAGSMVGDRDFIGCPLILIDTALKGDATEGLLVSDEAVFGRDDDDTPVCEEISFLSDIHAARGVTCSHLVLNGTRMRLNGYRKRDTEILAGILQEISALQKARTRL